ncbi:sulfotransferase family protein [Flavivirga jejuensis]|uniref:Sulfotransferase n=1 Tax=Flavivirga jejuensis TaxID=870487 RepID=A0ABT8WV10_9FLAO|nr:sulfotransferase [Flavivirga jejuensis]MDO5976984.1 sulfotransferase [Flavivirga jejuensis]
MNKTKAIQIIGTQRSGSNLLRVMLNQIQDIDAPHPPHILKRFFPLLPKYGNLNDTHNFKTLIDDVCKLIELNPVPWEGFTPDREKIRLLCTSNSLIAIFNAIYSLKATATNSTYWCCKSMFNVQYAEEIETSGINPLYIYLYRDGRDVALSFKKAIVGPKHIFHIAKQWKENQEKCIQLGKNISSNRFFSICYEDLLANPEKILRELCVFLNISFSSSMLDYHISNESLKTASSGKMWQNLSKPVLKDNFNKFLKDMSYSDRTLFENIAGSTLLKLNYKVDLNKQEKSFSKEEIENFNIENELLKQKITLNACKEDLNKKQAQLNLLKEITNRNDVYVNL